MAMPAKVKKWGSSMAVLIPRQFAEIRQIDVGTVIDLEGIQVLPARRRRMTIDELMAGYQRRHRHGEWKLGDSAGRETW